MRTELEIRQVINRLAHELRQIKPMALQDPYFTEMRISRHKALIQALRWSVGEDEFLCTEVNIGPGNAPERP